jgi:hypothetical protein
MRAILSPLLLLLLAPQEKPDIEKQVDELVEQLKTLAPDADRSQFLGRPAMSKLMSLGPQAFPRLKHHFLEQQDWRLKASIGYLAVLHGRRDSEVRARWSALCKDPDILVRMVMISLSSEFATGFCGLVVIPAMTPEEKGDFDRIKLSTSLHWMSEEDLKSLAINALAIVKRGKLLVDPPQLDDHVTSVRPDMNPKRLRSSGVRLMTPMTSMAQLSLLRVLDTSTAHEAMRLVYDVAEADDGSDGPRLGILFQMASLALVHSGDCARPCLTRDCPLFPEYRRRLHALCEKWAWKTTDCNAQYGVLRALNYIGMWKSYDLRERLSKEHPDEQVRELAGSNLARLWNSRYDRGYTREQEAEEDRRLERR